jgi:hypothetical protein
MMRLLDRQHAAQAAASTYTAGASAVLVPVPGPYEPFQY